MFMMMLMRVLVFMMLMIEAFESNCLYLNKPILWQSLHCHTRSGCVLILFEIGAIYLIHLVKVTHILSISLLTVRKTVVLVTELKVHPTAVSALCRFFMA
jgi:hypothetical protein